MLCVVLSINLLKRISKQVDSGRTERYLQVYGYGYDVL